MLGWLASLVGLLSLDLGQLSWLALAAALVGRTVLQTGLFIVGHDAMHGVLLTGGGKWNDRIGALA
ncbi:MAG: beta-carotene ketolase (CrtW type), partial [Cyanobium sp.]